MAKLDPKAFGLASGIIWLICYLIALVAFLIAPVFMVGFLSQLTHVDLMVFTKVITLGSVILGIFLRFIGGFIGGFIFAALYNKFVREEE